MSKGTNRHGAGHRRTMAPMSLCRKIIRFRSVSAKQTRRRSGDFFIAATFVLAQDIKCFPRYNAFSSFRVMPLQFHKMDKGLLSGASVCFRKHFLIYA